MSNAGPTHNLGELVPCGGGKSLPLAKPTLVVGRAPDCDVVLPFPSVSSRHCELTFKDGSWFVRDLGSRNGIRVDGVRCDTRQLDPNSTLSVAQHRFTVSYSGKAKCPPGDSVDGWIERSVREDITWQQRQAQAASGPTQTRRVGHGSLGELLPCGGGEPISLLKPKLLVGRHPNCDVVLGFSTVSSRHCELEFKAGYWFVRDLASRNGIRVEGVRCESKWLMPNIVLSIATHRYQVSYVPQSTDPPPDDDENPFARGLLEKAGLVSRQVPEELPRPQTRRGADSDAPRERWALDDER